MKRTVLIIALLAVGSIAAGAQTTVSEDKRADLVELVKILNSHINSNDFIQAFLRQQDVAENEIIKSVVAERKDLSASERKKLEQILFEKLSRDRETFRNRLIERVNFNEMVDEITMLAYDKFYTLDEIRDLIAFYGTPTGIKTLKTAQPLMLESMELAQKIILPKVLEVVSELNEEREESLRKTAEQLKPMRKDTRRRK
ncbi:MAG: DUF2059 domain-containing protein [Acidobacteria bacterium]|nr:DUF2059 domain-containing protein [Acidobacteriota bacterium]